MTATEQRRWRDANPRAPRTRCRRRRESHIALAAFLAWIGIGATVSRVGLGPAEDNMALGTTAPLALYLAMRHAFTVFVISLAYNQVIELFPNGGGGYKSLPAS